MFSKIAKLIDMDTLDVVDKIANRVGLGSFITTVGITQTHNAHAAGLLDLMNDSTWHAVDWAFCISMIGGVLFIIEKIIVIHIRCKQSMKDKD